MGLSKRKTWVKSSFPTFPKQTCCVQGQLVPHCLEAWAASFISTKCCGKWCKLWVEHFQHCGKTYCTKITFFFFGANEIFSFSRSPVSRSEVIFPTPFIQPLPCSFLRLWRDVCSLNHYLGFAALGGFGVSVILLCFTIRPADFRQEGEACQKLARSSWTQMWDLGSCSNIALRCIETWRGLLSPHLAVQFRGETSRDSPKIEPGLLPS